MENLNTKNEIVSETPLTVDNITGRPIFDHDDPKEEIVNDLAIAYLVTDGVSDAADAAVLSGDRTRQLNAVVPHW